MVLRILITNDNPDDRLLELREALALLPDAQGLEVTSSGGFEAALASGPPDLVMTNWGARSLGQDMPPQDVFSSSGS